MAFISKLFWPPPLKNYLKSFWGPPSLTVARQLISNRICYQLSKPEMEFHMIDITYAAMHMRAQTKKTTFSWKDDCKLTKRTRRWTYLIISDYYFASIRKLICLVQNFILLLSKYNIIWQRYGKSSHSIDSGGKLLT